MPEIRSVGGFREFNEQFLGLPNLCPTSPPRIKGMKNRVLQLTDITEEQVIASFGDAKLVKVDGTLHLRGGSMSDRIEALEWVSLFLPEEAVRLER